MSFAVGAFSGGVRGAVGGGGSGGAPKTAKRSPFSRNQQDPKEGKEGGGTEGDVETPNNTNQPMTKASLMFHALTSGIGALGRDGPDKT